MDPNGIPDLGIIRRRQLNNEIVKPIVVNIQIQFPADATVAKEQLQALLEGLANMSDAGYKKMHEHNAQVAERMQQEAAEDDPGVH